QTSNRSFSALALLHSGQRSAATIPFIQHSQNEKILDYLVSFLSDFSITIEKTKGKGEKSSCFRPTYRKT
ncbi:MAG: hypothetical protein IJQ33_02425, partial [Clostridia bacterium]|nr:hypothetical protein [Clostridia bacterium]